jgi:hypothetical protein
MLRRYGGPRATTAFLPRLSLVCALLLARVLEKTQLVGTTQVAKLLNIEQGRRVVLAGDL